MNDVVTDWSYALAKFRFFLLFLAILATLLVR